MHDAQPLTTSQHKPMTIRNTDPRTSDGYSNSRGYFANIRNHGPRTALATIGLALLAAITVALSCTVSTPTPTAAPMPTPAPTATATPEPSPTATTEPSSTPVPTPTASPSPTPTATATATPSPTPTASPLPTATPTPLPTATATPTPSPTPSPTATPSPTPTATPIPLPSPEEQRAALAAFYAATDGDNWTNNEGWLSDMPLDQWHGVTTDQEGNVIRLWLSANNLSGQIPAEVGRLTHLVNVFLQRNLLTGIIPREIGLLFNLTSLDLSRNRLSGYLPLEVGYLEQLGSLNIEDNELSGKIPDELGNLTELGWLYVSGNEFDDCIPDTLRSTEVNDFDDLNILYCTLDQVDRAVLVKLYNSTNGNEWEENANWLTDMPLPTWHGVDVNAHGKVTGIDLQGNNLDGELVPEIGHLSELTSLNLGGNHISGGIPTSLAQLTVLTSLDLDANRLTGSIPTEFGNLKLITNLSLKGNELTGEIPETLGTLTELQSLLVAGNEFDSCIPDILQSIETNDFNELTVLYCTHDTADRVVLATLYNSTNGDEWSNNENWLSDTPIPTWHGVESDANGKVTALNLRQNNLNGTLIPEIAHLTNLTSLDLGQNRLTGTIPPEIGELAELSSLLLNGNLFTGKIPDELGNLTQLQSMRVYPNKFGDCTIPEPLRLVETNDLDSLSIPFCALIKIYDSTGGDEWKNNENWFTDTSLTTWHGLDADGDGKITGLNLRQNNLNGTLIPEIGQLVDLTTLNLSDNRLTGTIPPEIGDLRLLEFLSLEANNLSGTVPPDIGEMTELSSLLLNGNLFTGKIPDELGNLTQLQTMRVFPNKFEDCTIPDPLRLVETNDFDELITRYCTPDPRELDALVKLYNSTNGNRWRNNTNWLSDKPLVAWHGVEIDTQGKVTGLDLSGNGLNGTLPPEIGQLTELISLRLRFSRLTGTIPAQIAQLTNLQHLDLKLNGLSGRIPAAIGRMTKLEHVDLNTNGLSGAIPSQLSNLGSLTHLDLGSNDLTGPLPSWLGDLPKLERLYLNDNQLTGDLSNSSGGLEDLQVFSIVRNNLTGCIPESLRTIEVTDFAFTFLNYCDEPPKQPPITPEFIKWRVEGVRAHEERAARLGVQWLFEFAESIGWPIVGDDITVYFMAQEPLLRTYAMEKHGSTDDYYIAQALHAFRDSSGLAQEDSNFNLAVTDSDRRTGFPQLFGTATTLIHENIHTAFQSDIIRLNADTPSTQWLPMPQWFIEGMATYFTYVILSSHGAFDGGWNSPLGGAYDFLCRNCEWSLSGFQLSTTQLSAAENDGTCEYVCGALAIELLASIVGQRHIVDLFANRQPGQTFLQNFQEVFDISVPDFYALYDQHRDAGFPELNPPIVPETGR